MAEYKSSCLKQNIKILIEKNHITQQKLAEAIGMTQSNLSKALNENGKREFTIEQLCSIAEFFNVSTDSLLDRKDETSINFGGVRGFGRIVAELLDKGEAKLETIRFNERARKPVYNEFGQQLGCEDYDFCSPYSALFLPNYWNLYERVKKAKNNDEVDNCNLEYNDFGNETKWQSFNEFLKHFTEILNVYHAEKLSEETFRVVLNDMLNRLPDY